MAIKRLQLILERRLLDEGFLAAHRLPGQIVTSHLADKRYKKHLADLVKRGTFGSEEVLSLHQAMIEDVYGAPIGESKQFLEKIYAYTRSLAFPETVKETFEEPLVGVIHLYLEALRSLLIYEAQEGVDSWQGSYPLTLLTQEEEETLEDPTEYRRFKAAFFREYVYEMMKVNQDLYGFTTLDHVCGVHHLALKVARQMRKAGYPVDLGRVSGAAAGHDIGKYGTKDNELGRIAHYHYYYTGQWYEDRGIVYIRNVAINHSTWDLELEHLPIESLILIYADFRVKSKGKEMAFYSLADAFDVILAKLEDVDEAKEQRYRKVYASLQDFEAFLHDLRINTRVDAEGDLGDEYVQQRKHFSLMQGNEVIDNAIYSSIHHNIKLLHRLRDESSLNKWLEPVRSASDPTGLRGYLAILEQYYTYMTQKQKQIIIRFLYEKLSSRQEDIRQHCGELIGKITASFDEKIRKELPPSCDIPLHPEYSQQELFNRLIHDFLYPEQKIIERHRVLISYTLRDMVASYFTYLDPDRLEEDLALLLGYIERGRDEEKTRFYLLKMTRVLPFAYMSAEKKHKIIDFVMRGIESEDQKFKLRAYNTIYEMLPYIEEACLENRGIRGIVEGPIVNTGDPAENYARLKLAELLGVKGDRLQEFKNVCIDDVKHTSTLYLSNLKSATLDIAKRFQIELLMRNTILFDYDDVFYTAMHLCNLLKVSALETVRNTAGRGLIELVGHLNFEQKNDIVVELIRALEMESYEFTKYIPDYLGILMLHVKPNELDEIIEDFVDKMKSPNSKVITLMLMTAGVILANYPQYELAFPETEEIHRLRVRKLFGLLFTGFVHESHHVNQTAFRVLSHEILAADTLDDCHKIRMFSATIKKIMSLMVNTNEKIDLIFFNNSAGLKEIYQFIAYYRLKYGEIITPPARRIAFFPGAFDPFTLSHKKIAVDIRDKGFEVYLAVDEFSWSKRTQPNLIRREIIKKSIASEIDVYTHPRDISINIANAVDLKVLRSAFNESEVYLVVGSDVLIGASAYRDPKKNTEIFEIPHVVYERKGSITSDRDRKRLDRIMSQLHPNSIVFELPEEFEHISSTMIRDYIDDNRDISELIDPLSENYIYQKGLYQREPLYKSVMTTKSITMEIIEEPSATILEEIATIVDEDFSVAYRRFKDLIDKLNFRILVLRSIEENRRIIGFSIFHWLRASAIHSEFRDERLVEYVREHSVGRILVIDGIYKSRDTTVDRMEQIVLTETLSYVLSKDYSYGIYKEAVKTELSPELVRVLENQGFMEISSTDTKEIVYAVDMTAPVTLNLDITSMFKQPFRSNPRLMEVIESSRNRLQQAITRIYPGNLVLNFDRMMIYENLIKKICDENDMPTTPLVPKTTGEAMCVPFGAIFNRWILPNTVTKTLHVEKYFEKNLKNHAIRSYPYYLDIENQIKMIKSYDRPVILVDDLLNKGYRIKVLEPLLKKYKVPVKKMIVGIMSGNGKAIMEMADIPVDSAYFIPKIKVWFYESKLYPFLGGDGVWHREANFNNIIQSVNMILPYASASYIKRADKMAIYYLSEVAIENAIEIMETIEEIYQETHERLFSVYRLGEVLNSPRLPYKGDHLRYDMTIKPSDYLRDDLEQLRRLKQFYASI